jgi:hypothetical protein
MVVMIGFNLFLGIQIYNNLVLDLLLMYSHDQIRMLDPYELTSFLNIQYVMVTR